MAAVASRAFQLSTSCKLVISMGDITRWSGDAIVNAANEGMLGGGGVDGAIHRAAGSRLRHACAQIAPVPGTAIRCPTGEARITEGFRLPAKYVIHTVGPIFASHAVSEPLLRSAYDNSLQIALDHKFKSVAFPAISCGVFGYPLDSAALVAVSTCKDVAVANSSASLRTIEFVMFGHDVFDAWVSAASDKLQLEPATDAKRSCDLL
ncbi:hypothetical protein AC1031_010716 [Aphanomyces cochlioides]|nr:hypothetical protein AC1031_010716 [Aphanomyces cochlioides]